MCLKENIIDLKSRCKGISGKSGAFFYYTIDKNFILKSVSQEELDVFLHMIKDYTKRLNSAVPSFLSKILGVFKIWVGSTSPTILILSENLCKEFKNPLMFDLKGSSHERKSSQEFYKDLKFMPRNTVYKDLDFCSSVRYIQLPESTAQGILRSLDQDTELLQSYELMDYSILLNIEDVEEEEVSGAQSYRCFTFQNYRFCIGIIDYLQCYSARKKFETKINTLKPNEYHKYSCIPPDSYRTRFLDMAKDIFLKIYCIKP